jgi:hypothetical protein
MRGGLKLPMSYAVLAMLILLLAHPCAGQERERLASAALFEQFETVFYAEGKLVANLDRKVRPADNSHVLLAPFVFLRVGFEALGSQTANEILGNSSGILVGAKNFQSPKRLEGPVVSDFCYVILLGASADLSKDFVRLERLSEVGMPVWKLGPDPKGDSMYVSPVSRYLLVSNNLAEMRALGSHLLAGGKSFRAIKRVRDWSTFSQHEVWGYRLFRHEAGADLVASAAVLVTPGAEAVAFFFKSDERLCVLRLVNSQEDESTARKLNEWGALPRLERVGQRVWQSSFSLAGAEENLDRIMSVMSLFGFGFFV